MTTQRVLVAVAACTVTSLALVTGSAQAQSRPHGVPHAAARPNLVKRKGARTYLYCGSEIGCTAELVVYPKTKTFEFIETSGKLVSESGVIETVKVGKTKHTDFRTTSEYDLGCLETSVKTKGGYNSEAEQGVFECPHGLEGAFLFEETWYAVR